MASIVYNKALHAEALGAIDYDTDTFKAMLLDNGYTANKDTHEFRDDIEGDEVSGAGYTTGGVACSVSVTRDDTTDRTDIEFAAVTFTGVTITDARYVAYYKSRGGASSADELVMLNDLGSNVTLTGGNLGVAASILRKQN